MRTGLNFAASLARSGAITRLLVIDLLAGFVASEFCCCAGAAGIAEARATRAGRTARASKALRIRTSREKSEGRMPGILSELVERDGNQRKSECSGTNAIVNF